MPAVPVMGFATYNQSLQRRVSYRAGGYAYVMKWLATTSFAPAMRLAQAPQSSRWLSPYNPPVIQIYGRLLKLKAYCLGVTLVDWVRLKKSCQEISLLLVRISSTPGPGSRHKAVNDKIAVLQAEKSFTLRPRFPWRQTPIKFLLEVAVSLV